MKDNFIKIKDLPKTKLKIAKEKRVICFFLLVHFLPFCPPESESFSETWPRREFILLQGQHRAPKYKYFAFDYGVKFSRKKVPSVGSGRVGFCSRQAVKLWLSNLMSQYYKSSKHPDWLFNPKKKNNFKLSRSKIDLFLECPRCFYLDNRLGVARPPGFPFTLNSAVDHLLKKEFDIHRAKNIKHPLMEKYGIDARPVVHEKLAEWRENFKGVQYYHAPTGLTITGAIDDLWINSQGEYIVVDYKSTSKEEKIEGLNESWHENYKRQMEIYQWLLRQNGYKISDTGYFVYCNGLKDKEAFDAKLEFDVTLIAYQGNDDWVEPKIIEVHKCLMSDKIPLASPACDYCNYIGAVRRVGCQL